MLVALSAALALLAASMGTVVPSAHSQNSDVVGQVGDLVAVNASELEDIELPADAPAEGELTDDGTELDAGSPGSAPNTGEAELNSASPNGYCAWPARVWITDGYGYPRTSFNQGASIRFYFTAYSGCYSAQAVYVVVTVQPAECFNILPGSCAVQTLRSRYATFPSGSSNWYVPATIEYSDQPGRWRYCVNIDGDEQCAEFHIDGSTGYPPPRIPRCTGDWTTIDRGQTRQGYISYYDDSDTYCFTGFGQVTIRMNRASGNLDPFLMVYDDRGQLVHVPYDDDDRGGWPNALVTFWANGSSYRIIATRYPGQGTAGGYWIEAW
jgi:hypothetical protein